VEANPFGHISQGMGRFRSRATRPGSLLATGHQPDVRPVGAPAVGKNGSGVVPFTQSALGVASEFSVWVVGRLEKMGPRHGPTRPVTLCAEVGSARRLLVDTAPTMPGKGLVALSWS